MQHAEELELIQDQLAEPEIAQVLIWVLGSCEGSVTWSFTDDHDGVPPGEPFRTDISPAETERDELVLERLRELVVQLAEA